MTTKYVYDAAGRLVKEGNKTYRYGYLDKVLSVTEGERKYAYDYHVDGQLARADYGNGGRAGCPQPAGSEDFLWDGLALIRRGDERFVNEPHVGGGNPVASSKGTTYFNDMLGTTLGAKRNRKYTPAALTAFGETIENGGVRSTPTPSTYTSFYTGKPEVAGLGHAFLFRNYRAGLAKWQTADPLGYPDGWNQLAYCGNVPTYHIDYLGCVDINLFVPQSDVYNMAELFRLIRYITIGGHGGVNGIKNGLTWISVSDLANMIRALDKFNSNPNMPICLVACDVAQGTFAQELANELNRVVIAADTTVWYEATKDNNDVIKEVHVYAADEGYTFGGVKSGKRDTMDKTNHWVRFKPE